MRILHPYLVLKRIAFSVTYLIILLAIFQISSCSCNPNGMQDELAKDGSIYMQITPTNLADNKREITVRLYPAVSNKTTILEKFKIKVTLIGEEDNIQTNSKIRYNKTGDFQSTIDNTLTDFTNLIELTTADSNRNELVLTFEIAPDDTIKELVIRFEIVDEHGISIQKKEAKWHTTKAAPSNPKLESVTDNLQQEENLIVKQVNEAVECSIKAFETAENILQTIPNIIIVLNESTVNYQNAQHIENIIKKSSLDRDPLIQQRAAKDIMHAKRLAKAAEAIGSQMQATIYADLIPSVNKIIEKAASTTLNAANVANEIKNGRKIRTVARLDSLNEQVVEFTKNVQLITPDSMLQNFLITLRTNINTLEQTIISLQNSLTAQNATAVIICSTTITNQARKLIDDILLLIKAAVDKAKTAAVEAAPTIDFNFNLDTPDEDDITTAEEIAYRAANAAEEAADKAEHNAQVAIDNAGKSERQLMWMKRMLIRLDVMNK